MYKPARYPLTMRYISLADLPQGESGTIVALHEQHHDKRHGYHDGLANRLMALGFLPGRTVKSSGAGNGVDLYRFILVPPQLFCGHLRLK